MFSKKQAGKTLKTWLTTDWIGAESILSLTYWSMQKKSVPLETTIYQLKFWIVVFLSFANVFILYQLFFFTERLSGRQIYRNISCVRLEEGAKTSRGYNYRFSTAVKFQPYSKTDLWRCFGRSLRGQLKFWFWFILQEKLDSKK